MVFVGGVQFSRVEQESCQRFLFTTAHATARIRSLLSGCSTSSPSPTTNQSKLKDVNAKSVVPRWLKPDLNGDFVKKEPQPQPRNQKKQTTHRMLWLFNECTKYALSINSEIEAQSHRLSQYVVGNNYIHQSYPPGLPQEPLKLCRIDRNPWRAIKRATKKPHLPQQMMRFNNKKINIILGTLWADGWLDGWIETHSPVLNFLNPT